MIGSIDQHLKKQKYVDLYQTIHDGKGSLPLLSLSGTRWLAHGNCVTRVLQQWEALKTHFQEASNVCDKYVAREVLYYVCNLSNELYFTFLKSLLHEFTSINLLFQKDEVDHVTLIDNLEILFLQMLQRIELADHFLSQLI